VQVLVSGAGIGGLAAARALAGDGHQVTVFERAPELRLGGAAVTLWSNGTGVLSDLGVSLDGAGAPIESLDTYDHRGRLLVSTDVAHAAARYGHPQVCLPRSRLLGLLTAGLPAGTIVFGRAAASCGTAARGPGRPRLTFEDGSFAEGDLLVAADGRASAVRDQLWGGDPGEPTGWATWQGVSALPGGIAAGRRGALFVGQPGTCGLMPAGNGLLQWWFDLRWTPGAAPPAAPLEMLRERFAGWAPPVRDVLAAVSDAETGFFPHYRHRVPSAWGSGPVTVIGDAAHSMPPTRAQGANQALEDGWALARALRPLAGQPDADVPAALRAFERSRSARVSVVARQAGTEDYNRYGVAISRLGRLIPPPLAARYYTRWLARVSSYLAVSPVPAQR